MQLPVPANSANWTDAQALAYVASYPDLIGAIGNNPEAARQHYRQYGAAEGRSVTFQPLQYVASYADLRGAIGSNALAAAQHYIRYGYSEKRQTGFNGLAYIASYSDLTSALGSNAEAGADHFIRYGATEGRKISFDGLDYIASYPDLIAALGANADAGAEHYIKYGASEGRTTSFDSRHYLAANRDLIAAFGDNDDAAARHFIQYGHNESRSQTFNETAYLLSNGDLEAAGLGASGALTHWIDYGFRENRVIDAFGPDQSSHALAFDSLVSDVIGTSGDRDYFVLGSPQQNAELTFASSVSGVSFHLFSTSGVSNGSYAAGDSVALRGDRVGPYYVTVDAAGGATGSYSIHTTTLA